MSKKLDLERSKQMADQYRTGMNTGQIATFWGVTAPTVLRSLDHEGVKRDRYRGGSKPQLSEREHDEIAQAYQSGVSAAELAKQYNVCHLTIIHALRRCGQSINRRGGRFRQFSPSEEETILSRYLAGQSRNSIGLDLGVNSTVLDNLLRRHGIEPENRIPTREQTYTWKGGRYTNANGYIMYLIPRDHPLHQHGDKCGYMPEHRFLMAEHLGRPLHPWETVHHKDGDRTNNHLNNLQLRVSKHGAGAILRCRCCGSHDFEYGDI